MATEITITPDLLKKSAVTYRKDILMMPVLGAMRTLQHMTGRPGLRGKQVVGEMSGDIQLGPYSSTREDNSDININGRYLETYLGSVVKNFDPNQVRETIYGSLISQGEGLKNTPIAKAILQFMAMKIGKNLNMSIWNAKRNESGNTTKDLFDGFDTITANEKAAGAIAASKGNLTVLSEAITSSNAVDALKAIYRGASDVLQEEQTKLFIPYDVYHAYVADYQQTVGSVPYNKEFQKTYLEGSSNTCQLVPLASKKGSKFIHLTTKGNMLYGYGNGLGETIDVDRFKSFILTFSATMYFGTQFESISPERLLVAELPSV